MMETVTTNFLSVDDARRHILGAFTPLPSADIPLDEALGLYLSKPVIAPFNLPPFANSAMDGFAIRAEDTADMPESEKVMLQIVREIPAGAADPGSLAARQAARIMTGAPLPAGANAVVPFEEVDIEGDVVFVPGGRQAGSCVRPAGLDVQEGSTVLEAGTRLGARQIALCAALGYSTVSVHRRPVISILATGDELVEVDAPLHDGQIYNSNSHALAAAVRELGAQANLLGIARDDPADLRRKIEAAVDAHSDLLLTSGGASVGDFDYVKDVIGATGDIHFWRVQIRPGKPIVFGTIRGLGAGRLGNHTSSRSLYLLGLPGNPTSAMVTYYIFARPAILTMMGHPAPIPEPIIGRTDDLLDNRGGRETYFRVVAYRAAEEVRARLAGDQDSSLLLPLSRANALARVPADTVRVEPDQPIELYPLESYGHPLGALWALVNE